MLRHCLPASIRQTLDQLPESLDETYLRVLSQIPQANQEHAHRMLQCLMVAVRPLRVEELAELLAFEFDAARGGIPKYRGAWRLDDQMQAVLSTCSSLVTIIYDSADFADAESDANSDADSVKVFVEAPSDVDSDADSGKVFVEDPSDAHDWSPRSRRYDHLLGVVQFSHFSVKEFLISNRLGGFSRYHIHPASAHTILTQACLGSLLHLHNHIDKNGIELFPLSQYAAQHWVEHAQFEDVASHVKVGIETLFDIDKPHFAAWIGIYDMDQSSHFSNSVTSNLNPLYYSVLCGFYDLVKHLAMKHPQYVNAIGGRYGYPLFAALREGRLKVAELLLNHGANVDARETTGETILLQVLSRPQLRRTPLGPLNLAEYQSLPEVVKILVRHNANINLQDVGGNTPLHLLSKSRLNEADVIDLTLLLLDHGAEVNRQDKGNQSPLHLAVLRGWTKLSAILLEHGADVTAEDYNRRTVLHSLLSESLFDEGAIINLSLLLLKYGARVNRQDKDNKTPLHLAVVHGWTKLSAILLEHGADVTAEDNNRRTVLHALLSGSWLDEGAVIDLALLLFKYGARVNRQDRVNQTPLYLTVRPGWTKLAVILLENDADATANGKTPLHILSESRDDESLVITLSLLLLKRGAGVNKRDKDNRTPLHLAVRQNQTKLVVILLENGADTTAGDIYGKTPLHILSESQADESLVITLALLLLKCGAGVNSRDKDNCTPLHLAVRRNQTKLAVILLEHGADATAGDIYGKTPLHLLIESRDDKGHVIDLALLLLKHGSELNARDQHNQTPLLLAVRCNWLKLAVILLDNGADATAEDNNGRTVLYTLLSESQNDNEGDVINLALLFLGHGAQLNTRVQHNQSPLHLAVRRNWTKLAVILLEHGADATAEDNNRRTVLHTLLSESRNYHEGVVINLTLLLLKHGAGVNRQDKDNESPLHLAVRRDRLKLAAILLEHGADATAEDNNGRSILHTLLSESRNYNEGDVINLALLLLEHGAQLNTRDQHNQTPLLLAVRRNWTKLAVILLEHGADATAKDNNGRTVLHALLSESRNYGEGDVINLALLLLIYCTEVNRQDKDNESPLHLVLRRDRRSLSKLPMTLLEHGADVNVGDNDGNNPLSALVERLAAIHGTSGLSRFLEPQTTGSAHDTEVSRQYKDNENPVLNDDAPVENKTSETPVYQVLPRKNDTQDCSAGVPTLSPERGVDIKGRPAQEESYLTLSRLQSNFSLTQLVQALLDQGANSDGAYYGRGETSLSKELKGKYH